MAKQCQYTGCNRNCYGEYCYLHKARKPLRSHVHPKKQSDRELDYQAWKEAVARPYVVERDGNRCMCCGRPAYPREKLDLDHIKGKGSHADSKRDLQNLQLLCRFPCHRNKTDHVDCIHEARH
jgi:hypothetical protein